MKARMIGYVVMGLALSFAATAASAQTCNLHKVNTSLLNISHQAGGDIYKDALFDGDLVCVAQQQNVGGQEWAYISNKVEGGNARTLVDGWSPLQYLQKASPNDAAGGSPPAASAPPAAPPPAMAAPAAPAAPTARTATAAATAARTAGPPIRPEDVLRYNQPIPFGPFPVNGRSIQDLTDIEPLFSPVEGLDESLWKKNCSTCHQWDQSRLCEQGVTYVQAPKNILRVPHPFGGALKIALMRWAKSGCE